MRFSVQQLTTRARRIYPRVNPEDVLKFMAVYEAFKSLEAEENERIHEEAMDAISDPYGDSE